MEERFLFTQVHEALDIPTPPGAYERLRMQLTKKPVRPFPWPALQTRWSKMSFRFAAGLAIIAIAVVAAAAAVAIHNSTNNSSPAGSRMSIQAYQKMVEADRPNPVNVWAACDDNVHTGCLRSGQGTIPLIQKWLDDTSRTNPPQRFVVVNQEMRRHLAQVIAALKALVADSQANDAAGMSRDYDIAAYGVNWTEMIDVAIGSYQEVAPATYAQSVLRQTQALDGCGAPCGFDSEATNCATSTGFNCSNFFSQVAVTFGGFQAGLIENAAPSSGIAQDMRLQNDLAQADGVLLAMNLDAVARNQARFNSDMAQLKRIKAQIDQDAASITG
ncbi:MAG TPA: hypothetical protein VGX22_15390 [Candidatus Dormibacteraeota bacterium]|nr:hypothetical protein [Candidatus Dormibacteraeota bacterium]